MQCSDVTKQLNGTVASVRTMGNMRKGRGGANVYQKHKLSISEKGGAVGIRV